MKQLSERLHCRVSLYGSTFYTNELGEQDTQYTKIKTLWAEITPQSGSEKAGKGNTLFSEISHKFVIRKNAVSELKNDMYFLFQGQRYDILYFMPNYKYRDVIEVFCRLVVET